MLVIDPIKPSKPPRNTVRMPRASLGVIDGFKKPVQKRRPARVSLRRLQPGARFTKLGQSKKRRLKIPWGLLIALITSPILLVLATLGSIGQLLVVVYGVVALIVRVPSRITFVLALAAFLFIATLQIAAAGASAAAMAVLAYGLLAIGVVSFAREARRDAKFWFRKS